MLPFLLIPLWPLGLSLTSCVFMRPSLQLPHPLYLSRSLISLSLHFSVSLCLSTSLSWNRSESHICLSGSLTLGLLSPWIPFNLFQAQSVSFYNPFYLAASLTSSIPHLLLFLPFALSLPGRLSHQRS